MPDGQVQFLSIVEPLMCKMPFNVWGSPCGFHDTSGCPRFGPVMWAKSLPTGRLCILMTCSSLCFSWSLLCAHADDEEAVCDALSRILLLRDRGRPMTLSLDRDAQETRHHVCFDNVGVIGSNVGVVAQRMEEVVEFFERQSAGVLPDGQRQHPRILSRRLCQVRGALLARRPCQRHVEHDGRLCRTLCVACAHLLEASEKKTFTLSRWTSGFRGSHGVPRQPLGVALERRRSCYRRLRKKLENQPRRTQAGINGICRPRSGT